MIMETTNPSGSGAMSLMDAALAIETPDTPNEQVEEVSAELDAQETEQPELEADDSEEFEAKGELEEGEEDDEGEQEPEAIVVKVDGEEIQVTLDELKSGYSRNADYTRKAQALAEQRKAFEAEAQAILAERQQYQQLLGALEQQLTQDVEPDWDNLRQTDPIEYSLQMADWQRKQQKLAIARQEQQRVAQMNQVQQQRQLAEKLQQEAQALASLIPEWSDKEKASVVKARVKEQGKKLGFSDEELGSVFDHRAVVALHKAALYDELMSKQKALKPAPMNSKTMAPKGKVPVGNSVVKRAAQQFNSKKDLSSAAQLLTLLEK